MKDDVILLPRTRDGLNILNMYDVQIVNSPEWMAWFVHLLKHVPDSSEVFPHGKWATIQSIEEQINQCAADYMVAYLRKEAGE